MCQNLFHERLSWPWKHGRGQQSAQLSGLGSTSLLQLMSWNGGIRDQPETPGLPPTLQICHRSGAIRDWLSAQVSASQNLELPFDADIRKCHIKLVFQQICLTSGVSSWYPLASVFFLSCSFSSIPVNQFYCCLMLSLGDPRLHSFFSSCLELSALWPWNSRSRCGWMCRACLLWFWLPCGIFLI